MRGKTSAARNSYQERAMRSVYLFRASEKLVGGVKWGYINQKGVFVLPPVYDHAGDFEDSGLAIIGFMGLDGLIDTNGYFVVKPKYETIHPFSEGRATVIDKGRYKVIDEMGKEITERSYEFIGDYKEGRAVAAVSDLKGILRYGFLNRWGKDVIPPEFEAASEFKEGKALVKIKDGLFALISLTGKKLHTYQYANVENYGEERLAFQAVQNGKYGYMDEKADIMITPRFSWAGPFTEGRAIINVSDDDIQNKYGLIDRNGFYFIKPAYESIHYLGEGRIALGKAIQANKPYMGLRYALADLDGHILTGFLYNSIDQFEKGMASASNNLYTFFIDRNGKRIEGFPAQSGNGALYQDKTLIRGEMDLRLFYFDKSGKLIWRQNKKIPLNNTYSIVEKKYKPNKDYLVYYPQLEGIESEKVQHSVNERLKELSGLKQISQNEQLESNYSGDFEVTFYQKKLVVIEVNGYDYHFGAAHGMPVKKYAHVNLDTGEFFQLRDLFKKDSSYIKTLNGIIEDQIKNDEKYSYVFQGRFKGIRPAQPFFISEDTLNIYFDPYEIAPYAAGFPTFQIPFEEIDSIIDKKAPFWQSFN
ncbi:WG repeat-containing protein [Neobacillus terrae]|uniref:WG repeat-containing protein n=1 Tax=Neobacillus terrae TaxID=3034837 RepID=UPI001409725F|nr:WG repeat-containing protein [Neobacillus terrae]NHM31538.1 DUF3298 domain-containing protein [Neobacillus terrae]